MVSGTYHLNITFEWISGAYNKAAYCLSQYVHVKGTPATTTALVNMLVTSTPDGPAICTHSKTCNTANTTLLTDPSTTSTIDKVNAPHLSKKIKRTLLGSCRGQIPSANAFPRDYSVVKHPYTK